MKKRSSCAFLFVVLSLIIISPFTASAAQYDFSSLGTADGGFKPQGNRFLVSQEFTQDDAKMYYDDGTNETVTGMVIKADGTNLSSFDLEDMQISPFQGAYTVSMTITADLSAGGTESQTVSSYYLGTSGQAYSLADMGMDFSAFNDVTELRIDLTVHSSVVWNIDFNTITINDEQAPVLPGTTPTTQASGLTTASTASDQINIYWQNGDGSKRIVFVKQGNSGTPAVSDGTAYLADSDFSAATDIGDGWRCVFNGTDHVTSISGLTADRGYRIVVYEFDGLGGGEAYLTSIGTNIINQSTDTAGLDKNDFSSLGAASGGFKPQGGRYLVSDAFTNDGTSMYYDSSDAAVTGMVIKPNGTSLLSFDLVDMEFRPYDTDRVVSISVTADLKAGGTANQSVSGVTMYAGIPYSLVLLGMDFSTFNDVTELRFDITTDSVRNIDFDNLTIEDPDEYVSGTTPTTQATDLKAASNGTTDINIYWQNGDGSKRIVFVKQGNTGTPTIVDGTVYQADSDFSAATDIGGGWKCVWKGTENHMTISGLIADTEYRIVVYEFDGSGGGEVYLTSIGTNIINHSTSPATIEKYDFSGLGAASDGFKPQGNRFLVSDTFTQDETSMYYADNTNETVTGIVIKPDGTNLASFDLSDMEVRSYGADHDVSITVTADLSAGGTASQSISNVAMIGDLPYSLVLLGLDFSGFDDVTELRFDVAVTGSPVNILDFDTITLADQKGPGTPPTVSTQAVTGIGIATATGNGTITDLGDPAPTAYGVVWNTTGAPTTADSATDEGAAASTGAFTSSMTGLAPDTTYYVRAYATNTTGTAYGAEVSFTTDPQAPTVTTQAVTGIGIATATGNGTITDLGNPSPTAYGVVWNTTGAPITADNSTDEGAAASTGAFASSMTGLAPDTTYYVRAYATNTAGTVYGAEVSFTTDPQAPTVTTQAVTGIGITTATGNGTITDLGSPSPTAYGVVWNTAGTPTTADNSTDEGAAVSTGAFTSSMTGLAPNSTYYVRAYATNTAGTVYGAEVSFATDPQPPTVTTQAMSDITGTTATGNGTIADLGDPSPTAYGIVWNTAGTPTTADSLTDEGAATSTGAFTSSMTGLSRGITYYVRAYATNATGTVYGGEVSFTTDPQTPTVMTQAVTGIGITTATGNGNITNLGSPSPTAYGVVWNTTGTPTTADNSTDEGAAASTGAFTSSMTGLAPNSTYYVRAYATNTAGTVYGAEVSFTTDPQPPTVTTQAMSDITGTTATGNGTITDLGAPSPTAYGIVWNTTGTPTTADSLTDEGAATSTGAFTSSMTGLSLGITYYVRAYATNATGTVYGDEVSFTTSVVPASMAPARGNSGGCFLSTVCSF